MTESFEKLEMEIDAALAEWSDALDILPPDATIEHTRMAARIASREALLSGGPLPSAATIQRVRSQVSKELSAGHRRRRFLSALGIWAWTAAAIVAIAFGLAYYTYTFGPNRPEEEPVLDDAVISRFIAVNETLMPSDSATLSISDELDMLEESISTWEPTWAEWDELLESLDNEAGDQSRAGDGPDLQLVSIRIPVTGDRG